MTASSEPGGSMKVLIIGAGIGGLTAAIALRRAGIDAVVLEQAPELRAVGAGISLWPNAIKALRRLGVGDSVEGVGAHVTDGDLWDWRGSLLHSSPADELETRFGAPLIMVHRAALHRSLRSALDDGAVRLDSRCVAVAQDSDGVRVELADGSTIQGHVAIGADGLHSMVRAMTIADGDPRHSGLSAWRAVVEVESPLAEQLVVGESWGQGALFGVQRLPDNRVYWYAAARDGNGDSAPRGTEKSELLGRFSQWHAPIPELIEKTADQAILCNDLYDRPVPHSLAFGRVALLGDAAHPMLPHLGQGACQAIEDAEALADALAATSGDPEDGLALYSDRRCPRASAAVTQSRRTSQVAHVQRPVAIALRNTLLKFTSSERTMSRLASIVGGEPHPGTRSLTRRSA